MGEHGFQRVSVHAKIHSSRGLEWSHQESQGNPGQPSRSKVSTLRAYAFRENCSEKFLWCLKPVISVFHLSPKICSEPCYMSI